MKAGGFGGVRCYLQSLESNEIGKTLSDDELLSRFLSQPDAFIFGILLRRHGPMIYAVCRRTLRDAHDVEDAFQATFLVFVRKAASIRRREVLGSWFYAVAHRVAVRLRNEISRRRIVESPDQEAIASAPSRELSEPVLNPILDEELRRLPAKYRQLIVLCYLQGKTNGEAAIELGWPLGTVKGRLARARRMLRQRLKARGMSLKVTGLFLNLDEEVVWRQVPKSVVRATSLAARQFLAGHEANESARAILLANGVIRTMFAIKLATYGTVLLAAVALMVAGGLLNQTPEKEPGFADAPLQQKQSSQKADVPGKQDTHPISVSGIAKDEAGKPVPGAQITLFSVGQDDVVLGKASTDSNGHYKVGGLLPLGRQDPSFGQFGISGVAPGKGLSSRLATFTMGKRSHLLDPSLASYFSCEPIEINLRFVPGMSVHGRVVDEDGKPVADAMVHALLLKYTIDGAFGLTYSPKSLTMTLTDANGHFRLENLIAGKPFELQVERSGFAPYSFHTWKKENMQAANSDLKFTLHRPRRLQIHVVCADSGKPVANVEISIAGNDPVLGKTNDSGQLNLELANGEYTLAAKPTRDSAYLPLEHLLQINSNALYQVTMVLKRGCILNLQAIDAQSGKGIKGIAFLRLVDGEEWRDIADLEQAEPDGPFTWLDSTGKMRPLRPPQGPSRSFVIEHHTTGPSGTLRAVVNPGTGSYRIVYVEGYEPEKWMIDDVDLPAGKSVTVQFKLRKK